MRRTRSATAAGAARVAVVVAARDAADHLPGAVASALAQPEASEVVVAAADDATALVARHLRAADPRVRVVRNPAGTAGAGLAAAIEATDAPVVARLDAHARLPDGYLARALGTMDATGAAVVGGRQLPVGRTPFERAVAASLRSGIGAGPARFRVGGPAGPVDTVYLGVYRRDALEAVGGFAVDLPRNQDYEVAWRLRRAGEVVWFDPALGATYLPRSSWRALARQFADYGAGKRAVLRRHPRSLRARQVAAPVVVVAVVGGAIAGVLRAGGTRRWMTLPAAYAGGVIGASAAIAPRQLDGAARLRLPAVLATMHLSWGLGFLLGRRRWT